MHLLRAAIAFVIVVIPVIAYASTGHDSSVPSLLMQAATVLMQMYLSSKLPPMERRLTKAEQDIIDIREGVIR